jgi:tetrapyrrole methylase family protein/MazG family protein
MIVVVGLGPGDPGSVTLGAWEELVNPRAAVWLRTDKHPVADILTQRGLPFSSFDGFYEQAKEFGEVYRNIAEELILQSCSGQIVVYAVPGHPQVAEESVRVLCERAGSRGIMVRIVAGMSSLEAVYGALSVDPTAGLVIADALQGEHMVIEPRLPLLITQVYSRLVAGELKLNLLEIYPPEHRVKMVRNAGTRECVVQEFELCELDRREYSFADMIFVPALSHSTVPGHHLEELRRIMARLRSEDGCPWDREQTHESLRPYLLEETYEVLGAIDEGDEHKLAEELGDLLLQIVFHAQIATEEGRFSLSEPIRLINEKMIRRHPHVFGDVSVADSQEVLSNWQVIKEQERGESKGGFLDSITKGLPALLEAAKVQLRAREIGFDWPTIDGAMDKVDEELRELQEARCSGQQDLIAEELGDLLFAVVNVSRFLNVEPETALRLATRKFRLRFAEVERLADQRGINLKLSDLTQLDELWNEKKKKKDTEN